MGLCPLSFVNLRCQFDDMVTASEASTHEGGNHAGTKHRFIRWHQSTASSSGCSQSPSCGPCVEEKSAKAQRVVEAGGQFSGSIDDEVVRGWSLKYSTVGLVLVGSGPLWQGVSGLNSDRKGALKDQRSKLFKHAQDRWALPQILPLGSGAEFVSQPWFIDSSGISLAHRPRLYWISWELQEAEGVELYWECQSVARWIWRQALKRSCSWGQDGSAWEINLSQLSPLWGQVLSHCVVLQACAIALLKNWNVGRQTNTGSPHISTRPTIIAW